MVEALIAHFTNGNKAQFAKALGVSPQTISAWIARSTFDSELIYTKCRYINPAWLLTGEGNMLKTEAPGSGEAAPEGAKSKKISGTKVRKAEKDTQGIPLIPLSAMAGAFTSDISVMEYECEHYIIPDFKGADFIIRVKGDSMQPTYYSGDLVACQKISLQDIFFQWNKTYVLDTDQGPLIKRVRRGTDDNHILIVSDNASYEPFELDRAQLHAVALVRGIIRLE